MKRLLATMSTLFLGTIILFVICAWSIKGGYVLTPISWAAEKLHLGPVTFVTYAGQDPLGRNTYYTKTIPGESASVSVGYSHDGDNVTVGIGAPYDVIYMPEGQWMTLSSECHIDVEVGRSHLPFQMYFLRERGTCP